ncbi:MAG: hypothetical protein AAFY99_07010 [Pseudomonadota bacterium]
MLTAIRNNTLDATYDMTNVIVFPGLKVEPKRLRRPVFAILVDGVGEARSVMRASAPQRPELTRGSVSPVI